MALRAYLISLTTRQAFVLFFLSFALGAASILLNFGVPWIPALAVFTYGGILIFTLVKYHVQHSESTTNSPYFLGFLFFLLSLFMTFHSIAFDGDTFQLGYITRQLGSALLTTIIGLPMRQALLSLGRSQADQDLFFRTLEDELRQSATEYRKAQAELVQLVRELTEARRVLLTDERKAVSRYVASLRKATEFLDGTVDQYPAVIAAAVDGCNSSLSSLRERLETFASSLAQLDGVKIQQSFEACMSLPTSVASVESSLAELRNSVETTSTSISGMPALLNLSLKATVEPAMHQLQESVAATARSLAEPPKNLAVAISDIVATLNQIPSNARKQLSIIESDITSINSILSQFVDILQTKIEALN